MHSNMRSVFSCDSVIDSILSSAVIDALTRETADLRDSSAPRITLVISTIQDRAPATMHEHYMHTRIIDSQLCNAMRYNQQSRLCNASEGRFENEHNANVEEVWTADCPVELLMTQNGLRRSGRLYDCHTSTPP